MDCITPGLHDPDDLVRLALISVPQGTNLYGFRAELRDDFARIYEACHRKAIDELMKGAFTILDWYFFQRKLFKHGVRLSVGHHEPTSRLSGRNVLGLYKHDSGRITVFRYCSDGTTTCDRKNMLAVLVHEMVHAYLYIFSEPRHLAAKVDPHKGHGLSWNVLYHSLVNTICQMSPIIGVFGVLTDEYGYGTHIHDQERLEYLLDEDPVSEDEGEQERPQAFHYVPAVCTQTYSTIISQDSESRRYDGWSIWDWMYVRFYSRSR
ncbi:hypothetical protein BKA67DRAFT_92390 [Truncatella angustata]|uniref:SprT-like domain-containing protein n=1 Tax=Truncatella angustata TaxID=152316 RepID=A0A9P8RMW2_9PEZI|nr:uncharacterized protein BKA67DRAFT_92390 [Truncatella angustata]KAH6646061.1 hypothetical protein BKA67DRAFT_92390 [Truncatella angustata]